MAEISLAASIVGLVSLGIQIGQGLNLYIDSASNASPRVQAIATDIELAIQVVTELQTTIEDPFSRALINPKAQLTATKTISQFRRVFEQIKQKIPVPGESRLRVYQKPKWPFTESSVSFLRTEVEKAKTTLQLLMDVIIFETLRKAHADEASLKQRRQRIHKSKREQQEAIAAAEVAAWEQFLYVDERQSPDSSDRYDSDASTAEYLAMSNQARDFPEYHDPTRDQDDFSPESFSFHDNLSKSLSGDYKVCLRGLKAMQAMIEYALGKLSSASAELLTAKVRYNLVQEIDENGRRTLICLRNYVLKSVSHRTLMRTGADNLRRSSAEIKTSSPSHSHTLLRSRTGMLCPCFFSSISNSITDVDDFVDALEYRSDVVEHNNSPWLFEDNELLQADVQEEARAKRGERSMERLFNTDIDPYDFSTPAGDKEQSLADLPLRPLSSDRTTNRETLVDLEMGAAGLDVQPKFNFDFSDVPALEAAKPSRLPPAMLADDDDQTNRSHVSEEDDIYRIPESRATEYRVTKETQGWSFGSAHAATDRKTAGWTFAMANPATNQRTQDWEFATAQPATDRGTQAWNFATMETPPALESDPRTADWIYGTTTSDVTNLPVDPNIGFVSGSSSHISDDEADDDVEYLVREWTT